MDTRRSSWRYAVSRTLHVVAFGSTVSLPDEKKHASLRDAGGGESAIPRCLAALPLSSAVVLDNDPFVDLAHFAFADAFVAARSQFSHAAAALSRGVVVRPADPKARAPPRFYAPHAAPAG